MNRIGLLLWGVVWAILLLHHPEPFLQYPFAALALAILSLAAAYRRWGELVYAGGILFIPMFHAHAVEISGFLTLSATVIQGIADLILWKSRVQAKRQLRSSYEDQWTGVDDEVPLYSRRGEPLNGAAWREQSPTDFEMEVLELFRKYGFEGHLTPLSGDEGIDLELSRDGQRIVVQCKHYRHSVGQPSLRDFAGAMKAVEADTGYFITISSFTPPAKAWASRHISPPLILVDGPTLVKWSWEGVFPTEEP